MYADYPKSVTDSTSADVLLDEGAKGAVAEVNSQLLSISRISVGGYPGRLLKERMPNGTIMQAKMVLVGQRMYQVAITTPREDGADPETVGFYSSTAQKFLDSFELSRCNAGFSARRRFMSAGCAKLCTGYRRDSEREGARASEACVSSYCTRCTRKRNRGSASVNRRARECDFGRSC